MHNEHKELILTCIVEGHRPREAPWLVMRSKSEPLWTDLGLKSAVSVCEIISTKKKKKRKKEEEGGEEEEEEEEEKRKQGMDGRTFS